MAMSDMCYKMLKNQLVPLATSFDQFGIMNPETLTVFEESLENMRQKIHQMMTKEIAVQSPLKTRIDMTETMFLSLTLQIYTNVEQWREDSGEQLVLTTKVTMSREEKQVENQPLEDSLDLRQDDHLR